MQLSILRMMAILAALVMATPSVGLAQQAAPAAAATATEPAPADYVLGPEDVVEVDLLGRADYKTRARIEADGTIQLPLIGRVSASERTARLLGEQVAQALRNGGFFANPIVTVDVVGYASRYVTVLGAVGTPGLVSVNRPYRVSEILAKVGGVRDNGADYATVRGADDSEKKLKIKDLAAGGAEQDPFVKPGDKIFIPVAELFYISGQVNAPGAYPMGSDMTLQMAIARGGGLSASGSDRGVQVTRKGAKVKLAPSDKVEAGDVIVVKERFF
jgi:polysaccharide export outer membrane protein